MARESTITFEQVSAAAASIEAAGGKATSRAVREALGSGSMATVLKFMQQRKTGQAGTSQAVDDAIDPAIARAIINQIAAKVQEATSAVTAELVELQADSASIIAENERQAAELADLATDLAAAKELASTYAGKLEQVKNDFERVLCEQVAERSAAEAAKEALRAELAAERIRCAEFDKQAAVALAQLEAATAYAKTQEKK